jgi:hypothetical protein
VVLEKDLPMMTYTIGMSGRFNMSAIILTGLSYGKHKFHLAYPEVGGQIICMAYCQCGYEVEILYFKNYAGVKYLQRKWEEHIGTWKGWC